MSLKKNHITVEADKHLGGTALDRAVYNTKGCSEHLENTAVYKRLTTKEATNQNNILRYNIGTFVSKHKDAISPVEHTFLHKATFKYQHKLA
jgi:hypothetical protein